MLEYVCTVLEMTQLRKRTNTDGWIINYFISRAKWWGHCTSCFIQQINYPFAFGHFVNYRSICSRFHRNSPSEKKKARPFLPVNVAREISSMKKIEGSIGKILRHSSRITRPTRSFIKETKATTGQKTMLFIFLLALSECLFRRRGDAKPQVSIVATKKKKKKKKKNKKKNSISR